MKHSYSTLFLIKLFNKSLFFTLSLVLLFPIFATAAQVSLQWEPGSGPVAGYKVYYGKYSKKYTTNIKISSNTINSYTVTDLPDGLYYFSVTAFDGAGKESNFSNEVSTIIAGPATTGTGGSSTKPSNPSTTGSGGGSNPQTPNTETPAPTGSGSGSGTDTGTGAPTQGSSASARLVNLSTRAWVGTGDNVLIAGFVIKGTSPKQVLIRAIGPSMAKANVPNLLYDPSLTLYKGQTALASNDNWRDQQATAIQASGKAPLDPQESAILTTLDPGAYTAIVRGVQDATGNALVEVYDLSGSENRLINVSTRGRTETGDNVMIAGFVVAHNPKRVLIRALGPALNAANVSDTLADPTVTLYRGQTPLASNDNWQDTQKATLQALRKAPSNARESSIVTTLQPGAYTAIVRGVNGAVGNSLIEVYDLD
ncbi:MAG: fibronectin type III domain-containing protein [Candidatus Competibacteraceae bacterium]|nr:fibronectin type III domain-containing protein [Candidatus Competibacteraceae bacterium]